MKKYTRNNRKSRKSRRQQKKQRKTINNKRNMRGGCGAGTCQPMVGGEDPQFSTDIYKYNTSILPYRTV